MTYSLGLVPATPLDKGSVSDAASSPETARWFLVTPAIERALRNEPWFSYLLSGAVGPQYMGISPSGTQVYVKSTTGGGSGGGSTKLNIPAGAQIISYAEVLSALAPVAQRTSAPAGTSSKLPLYIGLGIGGLAVVGGAIFLMTRKKTAPVALAKNAARRTGVASTTQVSLRLLPDTLRRARGMTMNAGMKEIWWKCSRCGRSVHNHSKTRVTESRPRRCKGAKGKTSARCKFVRVSSRTSKATAFTKLSPKNARAIAASIDKSAKRFAARHEYPETKKDVRALKRVATLLRAGRTEEAVKRGWWLDTFVRDQLPKRFYKIPSRAYPPR